jgi:hypothetical protein
MNEQQSVDDQPSVFAAMRRQIGVTPLPAPRPIRLRDRLAGRSGLVLGGTGALIAAAAASAAVGVFAGAGPAFAIATTSSGLQITFNDSDALEALNTRLAADNLPLRVVPAVAGCTATVREVEANGSLSAAQTLRAGRTSDHPALSIGIVHLRRPPAGYTYIVGISSDRRSLMLFPIEVRNPVPACVGEHPSKR